MKLRKYEIIDVFRDGCVPSVGVLPNLPLATPPLKVKEAPFYHALVTLLFIINLLLSIFSEYVDITSFCFKDTCD